MQKEEKNYFKFLQGVRGGNLFIFKFRLFIFSQDTCGCPRQYIGLKRTPDGGLIRKCSPTVNLLISWATFQATSHLSYS